MPSPLSRVRRLAHALSTTAILHVAGSAARAQAIPPQTVDGQPRAEALAASRECVSLAETGQLAQARTAGSRAEALLQRHLGRQPTDVEALVGLGRTLSQCILPSAGLMEQGELSGQAIELLDRALAIDPSHWTARFVLASIHFRSPSFTGRGERAARELDLLLRQQGSRTDNPRFARTFELRGLLWRRGGNADSAYAVWRRGAALFPADTALARLATPPAPPPDAAAPTTLTTVRVAAPAAAPPTAPMPSVRRISKSQVLLTPGGTADVIQAVQLQPGATRVTEGSDVYTRGGDAAETPLFVNGGRVLGLTRFEGLNGGMFGALDPFVVAAVRYSSGGFSARHGNALSGVLEIETDGRPRERQLRGSVSLVQLAGTARAPGSGNVGGWVSARVSHTGPLLATHGRTEEFEGSPHSIDVIASAIAVPSPLAELRATAILERDDSRRLVQAAGWLGPFRSTGDGRALQLSSRWMASQAPLVVRANVSTSAREGDWRFGVLTRTRDEGVTVGRVDLEWAPSVTFTLRGGAERGTFTREETGVLPATPVVAPGAPTRPATSGRASARHVGGYIESELAHGSGTLTLGLRADALPGETDVTWDPRVAVAARRGAWVARVGGGVYHQGRFRAAPTIPDGGTPSGMARVARQIVAGLEREGETTLRAESYVKWYGEYAPLGAGPEVADGRARGVDVVAQRSGGGGLTGWVGYSFLDATLRLSDGRQARSPFDVTHSATASATLALGSSWSIGSTYRYGTGAPFTPITGAEPRDDGHLEPRYGPVMSARLPAYQRLDMRVMHYLRMPRFLLTSYLEVLNVADRRNASSVAYDAQYRRQAPIPAFFGTRTMVAGGEIQFR